jgi:hypothetical protein
MLAPFTGTVTVDVVLVYADLSAAPMTAARPTIEQQRRLKPKRLSPAEAGRGDKRISKWG